MWICEKSSNNIEQYGKSIQKLGGHRLPEIVSFRLRHDVLGMFIFNIVFI